jgi:polo-like kinase 1
MQVYDYFETPKHTCFVVELCAAGDLFSYIKKRRRLTEPQAKYFFRQILLGLNAMHQASILHRDIKLENLMLTAVGEVKIGDFGVSRKMTKRCFEQCGTPAYIAPELLTGQGYEGFKADLWSAGVCLYAMIVGSVPFKAQSIPELHELIKAA